MEVVFYVKYKWRKKFVIGVKLMFMYYQLEKTVVHEYIFYL